MQDAQGHNCELVVSTSWCLLQAESLYASACTILEGPGRVRVHAGSPPILLLQAHLERAVDGDCGGAA